ncbi:glucuronate isomerase [Vibrio chagasii]|nr:glucuronate isomerase [Vibrio chagasii]
MSGIWLEGRPLQMAACGMRSAGIDERLITGGAEKL